MSSFFQKLLGINWGTTLAGVMLIIAAVGRIGIAWRTKDFGAILADGQLVAETVITLLGGFGFIVAKDRNVTGVGTTAKAVDSSGVVTNVEGDKVGKQPAA